MHGPLECRPRGCCRPTMVGYGAKSRSFVRRYYARPGPGDAWGCRPALPDSRFGRHPQASPGVRTLTWLATDEALAALGAGAAGEVVVAACSARPRVRPA